MKKNFTLLFLLLFTITAFTQIPTGYYDGTEGLEGESLKSALHNIIDNHEEYSYDDLRDFILRETDEDPDNSNNVILLYTGRSQAKSTFGGNADDWNREHVWAKSHGDFGNTAPAGTDAHHIRPTDASVNSSRGNKDFDEGGSQHSEATGCYSDSDSWEPRDEVKGDVARMLFYMAVRYDGSDGVPDLEMVDQVNTSPDPEHGKLSTLLEWNMQDLPDDFELNRNEVIYGYQENRNPFIDDPSFATRIWGGPTPVEEVMTLENVSIYPNPVTAIATVVIPDNETVEAVSVFTLLGRELKVAPSTEGNTITFDTSHLANGIYFVQVSNLQGESVSVKFVKR